MTVSIRPVAAADRSAWQVLFRGYRDFYELQHDDAVIDTVWAWLMDEAHELQGLVAQDAAGEIVGIAHWRLFARPSRGGTAVFLDDLFTQPHLRGQGIGTGLIAELQAIAAERGLMEVRWITSETNLAAQRLYDRIAARVPFVTYAAVPAAR